MPRSKKVYFCSSRKAAPEVNKFTILSTGLLVRSAKNIFFPRSLSQQNFCTMPRFSFRVSFSVLVNNKWVESETPVLCTLRNQGRKFIILGSGRASNWMK